jgi:hypothetical protein
MKKRFTLMVVTFAVVTLTAVQISSCTKDNTPPVSTNCDVKGIYSGTATSSNGNSSPLAYSLRENNFAVGFVTKEGAAVTFGGYRNTCDSVIMSVNYNGGNGSYYLLEGKLLNNKTTIAGTFKNLTTPTDFGTFSISK